MMDGKNGATLPEVTVPFDDSPAYKHQHMQQFPSRFFCYIQVHFQVTNETFQQLSCAFQHAFSFTIFLALLLILYQAIRLLNIYLGKMLVMHRRILSYNVRKITIFDKKDKEGQRRDSPSSCKLVQRIEIVF